MLGSSGFQVQSIIIPVITVTKICISWQKIIILLQHFVNGEYLLEYKTLH
jgi:hypothetical protein